MPALNSRNNISNKENIEVKAIIYTQYGSPDVLQFKDLEKPFPKDHEVLVKIHAASANALDWHFMRASPFLARLENGLFSPKNIKLGSDLAGTVEAIGSRVTQLQPGDKVIGNTFGHGLGAFAEYVCVSEDLLVMKPPHIPFEVASALPTAALTALQGYAIKGRFKLVNRF